MPMASSSSSVRYAKAALRGSKAFLTQGITSMPLNLRRVLRADYLARKAEECSAAGDLRGACQCLSDALQSLPPGRRQQCIMLLCRHAHMLCKAKRHAEALAQAEAAASIADRPCHIALRARAAALAGQCRWADAAIALHEAYALVPKHALAEQAACDAELRAELDLAIQHLTRQQLAESVC